MLIVRLIHTYTYNVVVSYLQIFSNRNVIKHLHRLSLQIFFVGGKSAAANPKHKQFMAFVRSALLPYATTPRILTGPVCSGPVNRLSIYLAMSEGGSLYDTDSLQKLGETR